MTDAERGTVPVAIASKVLGVDSQTLRLLLQNKISCNSKGEEVHIVLLSCWLHFVRYIDCCRLREKRYFL